MLRRSVYLLAGIVSQGVVLTVWLVSRGADWTIWAVAVGVDRTVGFVSWGVDRATELPENSWGSIRSYAQRLGSAARCRTRYRLIARELSARYAELRRSR